MKTLKGKRLSYNDKLSPRREIVRLIRHLPNDKLEIIIKTIKELDIDKLTPDDVQAIEAGEKAIAKGETISLEEFCKNAGI